MECSRSCAGTSTSFIKRIAKDVVHQAVDVIAAENKRHLTREYLNGLAWDGTKRLRRLFPEYFVAEKTDYAQAIGPMFMDGGETQRCRRDANARSAEASPPHEPFVAETDTLHCVKRSFHSASGLHNSAKFMMVPIPPYSRIAQPKGLRSRHSSARGQGDRICCPTQSV